MPAFPKPKFAYAFDPVAEIARLQQHKMNRGIPAKAQKRLLLTTWNIANFGAQERQDKRLMLIAEMLKWFDVIAIQECRENFGDLDKLQKLLGGPSRLLFSDVAGNDERMAFVYDSGKLTLLEKIGEIAFPVAQLKNVKLPGIKAKFGGIRS